MIEGHHNKKKRDDVGIFPIWPSPPTPALENCGLILPLSWSPELSRAVEIKGVKFPHYPVFFNDGIPNQSFQIRLQNALL